MSDIRSITGEGLCPLCGIDIVQAGIDGDPLVWRSESGGRGWLMRDEEGALYYAGKSSSDWEEVTGFICPSCGGIVALPDDAPEEWS